MPATGRRVGVNVYQIIETVAVSLGLPMLVPVIIGPCYQIRSYDEDPAGSYDGNSTVYTYPELIGGAIPDPNSVVVYGRFRDKPLERLEDTDFTADASGITVNAGLTDSLGRGYTAMYIGYRAFRTDLGNNVTEIAHTDEIESKIGAITLDNPLAYAAYKCGLGTLNSFYVIGVESDDEIGYTKAAEELESKECYFMVPLTRNPSIIQMLADHVNQMSAPLERHERILLSTVPLILEEVRVETSNTGSFNNADNEFIDNNVDFYTEDIMAGDSLIIEQVTRVSGMDGEVTVSADTLTDNNVDFVASGVQNGDFVYIPAGVNAGYKQVTNVAAHVLTLDSVYSDTETSISYEVTKYGPNAGTKNITGVQDEHTLLISGNFSTTASGVTYKVISDYSQDKYLQANALKAYAEAYANKRVMVIFPDIVKSYINNVETDIESWYLAAYIAGRASFEKADQPFANLPLYGGFTGLEHSTHYFNETQLRTITSGGIFMVEQEAVDAPLKARRQYMTDTSDIKTREFSIVKAVDWVAKFYRLNLKSLVGIYNITGEFLDRLSIATQSLNDYVSDPVRGVVNNVDTRSISQDEIELDHVAIRLGVLVKYPVNEIDVYLYI